MIACPWCDEDASSLIADLELDAYLCPACGTSVELVEEPVVLDEAA